MNAPGKPLAILIAALGGEGGGVLTGWIVGAAQARGLPVQSTSIPGVAQRTGATTYYIEIVPVPWAELGDRRPVLSLVPGIGDIDVLLASELMEAGRAIAAGFVTPAQTLTIASTARFYVIDEKIAMGDGRADSGNLLAHAEAAAKRFVRFDMAQAAEESGSVISAVLFGALAGTGVLPFSRAQFEATVERGGVGVKAVMLGAIAGCGRLPIPPDALEAAIRQDGKAVEANLRGFRAGLEAARAAGVARSETIGGQRARGATPSLADLEREIVSAMSAPARDVVMEGARRLVGYQDITYAQLYIDRLAPIWLADERAGAGGKLLRETARHLAVRMSYEDVIRVAQAKIDPARRARIAAEMGAKPDEPLSITEFLKPGIEELASILPPRLAKFLLRRAELS